MIKLASLRGKHRYHKNNTNKTQELKINNAYKYKTIKSLHVTTGEGEK